MFPNISKTYIFATAGGTLTSFVAGAMAWWGPKFIALGQATTKGEDVSYAKYRNNFLKNSIHYLSGISLKSFFNRRR